MVLRKEDPESPGGLVPAPLSKANPPYPTTPLDEHPPPSSGSPYSASPNKAPAFNIKTPDSAAKAPEEDLEDLSDLSDDEWNRSDDDDDFEQVNAKDVPDALRPAGGKTPATSNALPDALRPGPPAGLPIKRSLENISPMPTGASSGSFGAMSNISEQSNSSIPLQTNNPYLKAQQTGQSNWGGESSHNVWGDLDSHGAKYEPVELPTHQSPTTPSHNMASLSLHNNLPPVYRTKLVDQPPLIAVNSPTPLTSPTSTHPPHSDVIVSNPWGDDAVARSHAVPQESHSQNGHHVWEQEVHAAQEAAPRTERERHHEDLHHLGDASSTNPFMPAPPANLPPPPTIMTDEQHAPALPPRRSHEEQAHTLPPGSIDTGVGSFTSPGPESPNTRMNRQRKEHYQIKHIRWHDVNKPGIRTSPILTQNLNGPCPLLALVNALVLSTPSGIETALVETLRTREQVSLGLLLDAAFDELMSGRRGTAAQELPDVSDLYRFLLALHTGLNVNPLFVPDTDVGSGGAMLSSQPEERTGRFENTPDMKLYRTFNIPLLHGWLPEADSEAHAAFNRVAKSYETSQYVQFQEEELDAKLQSGAALTENEQQMFTDIHSIKEFLSRWPTQLTEHGLKVMRDSIQPGQVAILFRNDHFSTLFKDPRTNKLLTLVTDQGYSSHDEIVWESLVDVNGQGSELFSGDFRPVGNNSMSIQQNQHEPSVVDTGDNQGWTTVQGRRGNQQSSNQASSQGGEPTSQHELSRAEQEDHDLALALQLQEEEEDRERRETAQRERDNQASVNAIAAHPQARPTPTNRRASRGEATPVIPPRRNNITTHRPANEPVPPPTYEEASTRPQYHPPQGHPASPQAPLSTAQGSAFQGSGGVLPPRRGSGRPLPSPNIPGRNGGRQSAGVVGQNGEERERERCVVM
jgi:hypothetical protein